MLDFWLESPILTTRCQRQFKMQVEFMHPCAHVYFNKSNGMAVVAPMHVNQDGIGYEQEVTCQLPTGHSPDHLGEAVKEALSCFSEKPCDLRLWKKADWPAFRASGLSSVARFEREFTAISVRYLNSSGAVAQAEVALKDDSGIGVFCTFNPRLPGRTIGDKLAALVRTFAAASQAEQGSPTKAGQQI
jgi:hypothetical protein